MKIGDIVTPVPESVKDWSGGEAWLTMVAVCVGVDPAQFNIICGKPSCWEQSHFSVGARRIDSHLKVIGHTEVSP